MTAIFETSRLRARRFQPEDAARLYGIHLDGEVKRWIPNETYEDEAEAAEAAEYFAGCVDAGELPYVLAVELKAGGELIGDAGVNGVEGRPGEVEIGFVIAREHRGQGLAAELAEAMTAFAVRTFGVSVLWGRVMKGNDASVRVLEKCRYRFVREETGAEDDPWGNGMLVYRRDGQVPD